MIARMRVSAPVDLAAAAASVGRTLAPLMASDGMRPEILRLSIRCSREGTQAVPLFSKEPPRAEPSSSGGGADEAALHARLAMEGLLPVLTDLRRRIHLSVRRDLVQFSTDGEASWHVRRLGPALGAPARESILSAERALAPPSPAVMAAAKAMEDDDAVLAWAHPRILDAMSFHERLERRRSLDPMGKEDLQAWEEAARSLSLADGECLWLRRQDGAAFLVASAEGPADDFGLLWAVGIP